MSGFAEAYELCILTIWKNVFEGTGLIYTCNTSERVSCFAKTTYYTLKNICKNGIGLTMIN